MATTSISKSIAAPKKRPRGLTIATVSLINAKVPLGAGAFYGFFIALVVGLIYPVLSKLNFNAYLTSNAVAGLVGAKLNDASSFSALIGLELYGAFYGLIWGGIIGYIAGAALPSTFENGTLDLALARPISRTRYYLELWFSAFLASVIMSLTYRWGLAHYHPVDRVRVHVPGKRHWHVVRLIHECQPCCWRCGCRHHRPGLPDEYTGRTLQ